MPGVGDVIYLDRMPGYQVGSQSYTSDSSTFTTSETDIGTITVSLISGVVYEVECEAHVSSSTAGDTVTCRIRQDNTTGTEIQVVSANTVSTTGNRPVAVPLRALYTAGATGSKTFVVTAVRQNGAGNVFRDVSGVAPMIITVRVAS